MVNNCLVNIVLYGANVVDIEKKRRTKDNEIESKEANDFGSHR